MPNMVAKSIEIADDLREQIEDAFPSGVDRERLWELIRCRLADMPFTDRALYCRRCESAHCRHCCPDDHPALTERERNPSLV